jgi:hypothetical protein
MNKANLFLFLFLSVYLFIFYFILYYHIIVILGVQLWHLQKCLQYILVKLTPSIILLYPLSLFPFVE